MSCNLIISFEEIVRGKYVVDRCICIHIHFETDIRQAKNCLCIVVDLLWYSTLNTYIEESRRTQKVQFKFSQGIFGLFFS